MPFRIARKLTLLIAVVLTASFLTGCGNTPKPVVVSGDTYCYKTRSIHFGAPATAIMAAHMAEFRSGIEQVSAHNDQFQKDCVPPNPQR